MSRSWVLILTNTRNLNPGPAVIGGYATREEAEASGLEAIKEAVAYIKLAEANGGQLPIYLSPDDRAVVMAYQVTPYTTFIVIPGAASSGPEEKA